MQLLRQVEGLLKEVDRGRGLACVPGRQAGGEGLFDRGRQRLLIGVEQLSGVVNGVGGARPGQTDANQRP